ncbi:hypothetical protein [Serratia rhizosphaerae]|uniref:hypothetical protein n=1 Tax=Serratia rhizosphaerae TaxID=2597702 RepID=UPI001FE6CF3B|nr:hypothetical protein [Serratia rhizosphaerae]
MIADIVEFEETYPESIDEEFSARWGNDVLPELWEQRQRIFLEQIRLLAPQVTSWSTKQTSLE